MGLAKFAWISGKFVRWEDANVHVMTHALHYGSAVFEGIRCYDTKKGPCIFRLSKHIDRLFYSAESIGVKIPYSKKEVEKAIVSLVKKNNLKNSYIRPVAFHGVGGIGVYPKDTKSELLIVAVPDYAKSPKDLNIFVSKFRKFNSESTVPGAKISSNYVNSILAMKEARDRGYDEALMLSLDGFVAEGPTENILIVKNGSIVSPINKSTLYGITLDSVESICKDKKIRFIKKKVKLKELMECDEAFYCGTGREISRIISVNGKKLKNKGTISGIVSREYSDIVSGKNPEYRKWLTPVR